MMARPTESFVNRIDCSCTDDRDFHMPIEDVNGKVLGNCPCPATPQGGSEPWMTKV